MAPGEPAASGMVNSAPAYLGWACGWKGVAESTATPRQAGADTQRQGRSQGRTSVVGQQVGNVLGGKGEPVETTRATGTLPSAGGSGAARSRLAWLRAGHVRDCEPTSEPDQHRAAQRLAPVTGDQRHRPV